MKRAVWVAGLACLVGAPASDVRAQEDEAKILLQTNPLSTDGIDIEKKEIKSRSVSKVSMMPQGLVDNFTKDEILDLIAYLRSAGDPKDKAFAK